MPDLGQEPLSSPNSAAVDLWLIATETVETPVFNALKSALSTGEQAQLQRIRLPAAQRQFVLSRGCLRYLLSRYMKQSPSSLTFIYGPRGKPALCPHRHGAIPAFNLSHSGARLLIGVSIASQVRAIGVDIEALRSVNRLPGLCRRCLTLTEAQTVLALKPPQADHRFLRYWTGKEAWLKAQGLGIADSMQTLELSLGPQELPPVLSSVTVTAPSGPESDGALYQWQPETGYLAAIAVQSHSHTAHSFHLQQTNPAALVASSPA
jgi:4'-phosphopantetheinyl transferase